MNIRTPIIAALVLLPAALLAGCGNESAHAPAHIPATVQTATAPAAALKIDSAQADTGVDPARYRFVAIPVLPGSAHVWSPGDTTHQHVNDSSLHSLSRFQVCGGARLPNSDSIWACFEPLEAGGGRFTFTHFVGEHITSLPSPRPAIVTDIPHVERSDPLPTIPPLPIEARYYATVEASTRDLFTAGIGIETEFSRVSFDRFGFAHTAPALRISGEALVLPHTPHAMLKAKASYYF